jgi:hypothetical protein
MPIIIENLDNIQHKCATRDSELVKTIQSRIENAGKDRKRFDTVIRGYSCEEYDDLCG